MSGGLNKAFMNDPKAFMRGHIIEMAWGALPGRNNAQVFIEDFDLVANGLGADGSVKIHQTR